MKKELVTISKFLSLVLRHNPDKIGLKLDKNGWADVYDLITKSDITYDTLEEVVFTNDKQRFSFNEDCTKIRANQGHSIEVDLELEPVEPLDRLYHGTVQKFIDSIRLNGIEKGKRQFVHLSKDVETAKKVAMRRGTPIILLVESRAMHNNGYKFYLSENKVWLTDNVPHEYIRRM